MTITVQFLRDICILSFTYNLLILFLIIKIRPQVKSYGIITRRPKNGSEVALFCSFYLDYFGFLIWLLVSSLHQDTIRQQELFSDYWVSFFLDPMVSLPSCILWFVVEMSQKGPEKSSKHPILPPKQAEPQLVIQLFGTE